ncbi:MAG: hypothetical protein KDC74_04720 [Flavobacteriaceae bacterium]|nr:hypothetical protein [Flavobacteriaceae bacterium]
MESHSISWWNLENLFDIENSPRRSQFLNDNLSGELQGWTQPVLDKKIDNLSSIIGKMNNNNGPDVLGVCEVENDHVLQLLVDKLNSQLNRNYAFSIVDGTDKRGIDTALIFDQNKYQIGQETYTLRITKRNSTRDLFQVHLTTNSGNMLVIILNHWPSRSGGVFESEPYRIMVAENLAFWTERIHEEIGSDVSILLMGDFNDNPFDRSLISYLLSSNNKKKVINARNKYFYNLMYKFMDTGFGTHVYGSEVNVLDQFLVSKNIISQSNNHPFKVEKVNGEYSVDIVSFPEMISGDYSKAVRFSRPNKGDFNPQGFSDHLPISITLLEN